MLCTKGLHAARGSVDSTYRESTMLCWVPSGIRYRDSNVRLMSLKKKTMLNKHAQYIHTVRTTFPDYVLSQHTSCVLFLSY